MEANKGWCRQAVRQIGIKRVFRKVIVVYAILYRRQIAVVFTLTLRVRCWTEEGSSISDGVWTGVGEGRLGSDRRGFGMPHTDSSHAEKKRGKFQWLSLWHLNLSYECKLHVKTCKASVLGSCDCIFNTRISLSKLLNKFKPRLWKIGLGICMRWHAGNVRIFAENHF